MVTVPVAARSRSRTPPPPASTQSRSSDRRSESSVGPEQTEVSLVKNRYDLPTKQEVA